MSKFLRFFGFICVVGMMPWVLHGVESFYFSERIGESFACEDRVVEPSVRLNGEVMYMAQGVGLMNGGRVYSPGCRVGVEKLGRVDLGAMYTWWGAEREQVFKVPIIVRQRVIRTEDRLDDFEGFVGHRFGLGKGFMARPYVGVEWGKLDSRVTINEKWEVLNRQRFYGPLVGVMVEGNVWRYFNVMGMVSFSYLDGGYRRMINERVCFEEKRLFPRSKMGIGMEGVFPVRRGSLRVKGGYEMHYFWSEGINGRIDWELPLNLRGFVGEVSFEY